jgi:hypothetical protein
MAAEKINAYILVFMRKSREQYFAASCMDLHPTQILFLFFSHTK